MSCYNKPDPESSTTDVTENTTRTIISSTPTEDTSTDSTSSTTSGFHTTHTHNKAADPSVISAFGGIVGAAGAGVGYAVYKVHGAPGGSGDNGGGGNNGQHRASPAANANPTTTGGVRVTAAAPGVDGGVCQNQVEMYFESLEEIVDDESSSGCGEETSRFQSSVASKLFEDMIQPFAR